MMQVMYTHFSSRLAEDLWHAYIHKIPLALRMKIARFQRWQDRQATLFGKMLLVEVLKKFGFPPEDVLNMLSYNAFGRPRLNDTVDFNISHSGGCVICAATDTGRVGIDVEETKPIDLDDFRNYLTTDEWAAITQSDRPHATFLEYWTKKESILKAHGQGLSVALSNIHIQGELAILYDEPWFLREIRIAPDYKCYLATNEEGIDPHVERVSF